MKKSELIFSAIVVPVDFIMLLLAGISAYFIRTTLVAEIRPVMFYTNLPFQRYISLVLAVAIVWIIIFAISGLYNLKSTRSTLEEFLHIIIASSAGMMGIIVYIFLKREWFDSRFIILGAWIFAVVFVTLGRVLLRKLERYLIVKRSVGIHKVLVIGKDNISRSIAREIEKHPASGYRIVKHLFEPDMKEVKSAVGNPGIDEIILADPDYSREKIVKLIDFCNNKRLNFKFVPNLFQTLTANIDIDIFTGVPLIELKRTRLDGWGRIIKRTVDIIGSIVGMVLLSPAFVIIAFVIKWDTEGPVFVKLKRISQGREFFLYKFRSMIKDAEHFKDALMRFNERYDGPLFKIKEDPRVTRSGRILRRYRLDELPQLINVLRGEMSLVGPRPHEPREVAMYAKHHKKVLAIKPGITGFAQISGSSDLPFDEEVKMDTYYIENWSLFKDIKILLKTFIILLVDRSAC